MGYFKNCFANLCKRYKRAKTSNNNNKNDSELIINKRYFSLIFQYFLQFKRGLKNF